jgi:glycosyltransferase involved in cell wall biosynthesis
MLVSIILISLNEAKFIKKTIESIRSASRYSSGKLENVEVILSDGGSEDETVEIVNKMVDKIVDSPKGRYKQLNYGARQSKGDVLLFLHADTLLPRGSILSIMRLCKDPTIFGGGFMKSWQWISPFGLSSISRVIGKIWEILGNWLVFWFKTFPGDNAIFIRRDVFFKLGGYAPLLVCEDFDLMLRLKRYSRGNSGKLICLKTHAFTSARRLEKYGTIKTIKIWFLFYWLWRLGIQFSRLNNLYEHYSSKGDY